jgi:putative hydrolase of the HAD superfamily
MIRAIVSDFGGVLTTPLMDSFAAFEKWAGIPSDALYGSIVQVAAQLGANPLHELETGRLSEREFLDSLGAELTRVLGRPTELTDFSTAFFATLHPNQPMIELMCELRDDGYRMAICTNNVREWESIWRAMLPVAEIFELVVDSAFVGVRKPEPEIYAITLERLGTSAQECLFIDDVEINCEAARAAGMQSVHFVDNGQAIPAIRAALSAS